MSSKDNHHESRFGGVHLRSTACSAFILTVFGLTTSLSASIIAPGGFSSPDVFTYVTGFTPLADTGVVNVNPAPGTSFNASYIEYVGRDTNNTLCGVAGQCLTFVIGLYNAGPGILERISTANFGSFITDVGYNTANGFPGIVPASVDRSADGNVVGFNFNTGETNIKAGQNSAILEIQTNAINYTSGTVSVQDGFAGFGAGFAPTATPEPGSMFLLGTSLVGLGFSRKFFRTNS